MNPTPNMENLIRNLGCSYDALVHNKVIERLPLESLYEDGETLEIEPADGLELVFWPDGLRKESSRFEMIHILIVVESSTERVYTGELPPHYSSLKNRDSVRQRLGKPITSKSPLELFGTGLAGWDTYQVDPSIHPAAVVDFQYMANDVVARMQFSLMDKHV